MDSIQTFEAKKPQHVFFSYRGQLGGCAAVGPWSDLGGPWHFCQRGYQVVPDPFHRQEHPR